MDLVAGCRVFVAVADRGSFTDGAATVGVPQPVASRRVAALESHLGRRLFDRTTRAIALTPFGRDVLPAARRLVELAAVLEHDARRATLRPLTLGVPELASTRDLAALGVAARREGLAALETRAAPPGERRRLVQTGQLRAALVPAPPDDATWVVPLGLAAAPTAPAAPPRVRALRPTRAQRPARRIWLQPEDDVPHVRDPLVRAAQRSGLLPAQVTVAATLASAAAEALHGPDLLLCSAAQADELGLTWRALDDPALARGYVVAAGVRDDAQGLQGRLRDDVARCLGAPSAPRPR
ncbi:LysR family transcriptional regulator [Patulibacter sp. SYSU D01012]|uniref:LysR family transcriptional regulator n=1 Tax=Patulibacter sp. SYSU D01012 TaxID=2817381 RepID=UPI001B304174|nr:LysR family transcriptional regulator [Patulibacter sp. SYSU D01012]